MTLNPTTATAHGEGANKLPTLRAVQQFRPFFAAKIKAQKQWEAWDDARMRVKIARIAVLSDPEIPHYEATSTFELMLAQPEGKQLLTNYFQEDDASVALRHVPRTLSAELKINDKHTASFNTARARSNRPRSHKV